MSGLSPGSDRHTDTAAKLLRWLKPSRRTLAKRWGWSAETQRLALLHVVDPAARFDAPFEAKIRRFYDARP